MNLLNGEAIQEIMEEPELSTIIGGNEHPVPPVPVPPPIINEGASLLIGPRGPIDTSWLDLPQPLAGKPGPYQR